MIAEIHHKISITASNLNEKLEDELTGNYFGNLRYIPFNRGLGKILSLFVHDDKNYYKNTFSKISIEEWNTEFWKKSLCKLGEIDCFMSGLGDVSLGIEVKYKSGLSSDDQLEREADMMKEWKEGKDYYLIFIAPKKDYCKLIYDQNKNRKRMNGVTLGYLTWEDALRGLDYVETVNNFDKLIIEDLRQLLISKGFAGFHGFQFEQTEIKQVESEAWRFNRSVQKTTFNGFFIDRPEIGDEVYEFR